jgi:hypothetical protein
MFALIEKRLDNGVAAWPRGPMIDISQAFGFASG